jgi:serine/threonine-protein kinase
MRDQRSAAGTIESVCDGGSPGTAVELADFFLHLMIDRTATAVWFEPAADRTVRVSVELGSDVIGGVELDGDLGEAILRRLALIAGIAPSGHQSLAGTARIRSGERVTEVVVTARVTDRGPAGELRRLERVTPVRTGSIDVAELSEVFAAGMHIGQYRIVEPLGRGGMGLVYRVEHEVLKRGFAMKVLDSAVLRRDPLSSRRFVREARAAARVRHPGIVGVSDFGTLPDGRPYLVMDLIDGRTVYQVRADEGTLPPDRALRLTRQIADALAAAHGCGVVHRDLTPANVFVTGEGADERVVIVDFGSAVSPDPESADVPDGPPGIVIGTPHYMAPEHIQGLPTDSRSDLYGLGVLLFEILSGEVPFDGSTARQVVLAHLRSPVPRVTSPRGELPDEVVSLVTRLLAKDPDARVQCASDLVADIDRCLEALNRRGGWRRWLHG